MSLDLSHFKTSSATIEAVHLKGSLGVDQTATVSFQNGEFTVHTDVVGGPPGTSHRLDAGERRTLLTALKKALTHPPHGLDAEVMKVFVRLLEDAVIPG